MLLYDQITLYSLTNCFVSAVQYLLVLQLLLIHFFFRPILLFMSRIKVEINKRDHKNKRKNKTKNGRIFFFGNGYVQCSSSSSIKFNPKRTRNVRVFWLTLGFSVLSFYHLFIKFYCFHAVSVCDCACLYSFRIVRVSLHHSTVANA